MEYKRGISAECVTSSNLIDWDKKAAYKYLINLATALYTDIYIYIYVHMID